MSNPMNELMIWLMSMGALVFVALAAQGAPTHLVDENPVEITQVSPDVILVDFGRAAYGNVRLMPPARAKGVVHVHFGEDSVDGRINRNPPGTVRYNQTDVTLKGEQAMVAAPPADQRNTELVSTRRHYHPPAILTPPEWGVVLPFRWVEIEGWTGTLRPEQIVRQTAYASTWNDDAASFESSEDMLNRIWELCRYSIKATTFAGVYVDGDRERIPYEADAYLNQLSHYYTDNDRQMARDTINYLLLEGIGTWPTEWAPHMVFMVYADWMHTGDLGWMSGRYQALKSKMLMHRKGEDGLILSEEIDRTRTDIVDWPPGERDGYVFTARISPRVGDLSYAKGNVPTPRGPIHIDWTRGETFRLSLQLPGGMAAHVDLPKLGESDTVLLDGKPAKATDQEGRWVLDNTVKGSVVLEVKEQEG